MGQIGERLRIVAGLSSMTLLFVSLMTWGSRVTTQAMTTDGIVRSEVQEAEPPPEVAKKIAALRKRIQDKNLRFEVGYSKASKRTLKQLAGTMPPADLKQRIIKQKKVSAQHLSCAPES